MHSIRLLLGVIYHLIFDLCAQRNPHRWYCTDIVTFSSPNTLPNFDYFALKKEYKHSSTHWRNLCPIFNFKLGKLSSNVWIVLTKKFISLILHFRCDFLHFWLFFGLKTIYNCTQWSENLLHYQVLSKLTKLPTKVKMC